MVKSKFNNVLKNLVGAGDLNRIFDIAEEHLTTDESRNNLLILKGRFSELEGEKIKGVIQKNEYSIQKNKLLEGILVFIDTLEEKDIKKSITRKRNKPKKAKDSFLEELKIHGIKRKLFSESGKIDCIKELIKFKSTIFNLAEEYAKIGFYKIKCLKKDSSATISIDKIIISMEFCPRAITIGIYKHEIKNSNLTSSDFIHLDVNNRGEIIWRKFKEPDSEYSCKGFAELVLRDSFEILMNFQKNKD